MASATSNICRINVNAPASLPALGAAKLIAAADAHQAIRPAGLDAGQFTKALFEAYGCGVHNPDYSTDGAFMIAGSGGHAHYEIVGAAGFDFTARAWFWRGVPGYTEKAAWTVAGDTNGSPWYELNAIAQTPAPPHPYGNMNVLRAADGGGAKGSVIHIGRGATCAESISSQTAHKFNCDTGVWARASSGQFTNNGLLEGHSVWDPAAKRWYSVSATDQHAKTVLPYLDAADWAFKQISTGGYATPGSGTYACALYWSGNGKRLLILMWGSTWNALDLDYPDAGWRILSHTGASFAPGQVAPCWHQGNGNLYWRPSSGAGHTLIKIVPPADPLNGTWVKSVISLSGDAIPEFMGAVPTTEHYKSLFYIPSLNMLGWVTAFGVSLINPN